MNISPKSVINLPNNPIKSVEVQRSADIGSNFGVITIKLNDDGQIAPCHHHFIFSIDCSGSMSELCTDNKTRMDYIKLTLKSMIRMLLDYTPRNTFSITIVKFDSAASILIDTPVTRDTVHRIMTRIDAYLCANGLTDICAAICNANMLAAMHLTQYPTDDVTHILLTDGRVTSGERSCEQIAKFVSSDLRHVFLGYGIHHDSDLLIYLSKSSNSEYYFIDNYENAGLVYTEVLFNILHRAIENAELRVDCDLNPECIPLSVLYDYCTNTWRSKIRIGDLVKGGEKTFHVRCDDYDNLSIMLSSAAAAESSTTTRFSAIYRPISEVCDLTHYKFRQLTQEYIYNAITAKTVTQAAKKILRRDLGKHLSTMQKWMLSVGCDDDPFMCCLCDDIRIVLLVLGTANDRMYTYARHIQQGSQRAYNVSGDSSIFSMTYSHKRSSGADEDVEIAPNFATSYTSDCLLSQMKRCKIGEDA